MHVLLCFLVLLFPLNVAAFWRLTPYFDFDTYYEELEEVNEASATTGPRYRRSDDSQFRMCGKMLVDHIVEICSCRAEKGSAEKRKGARRGALQRGIVHMCCLNSCRPSEIRAICCAPGI